MAEETPEPPATPPSGTPAPPPAAPPAEEDWETRFKYLLADFENFRKRTIRDQDRARDRARGELLRALLPVHEAFEKARDSVRHTPDSDPIRRGLELLWKEWATFLAGEGVEPLAKPGQPFRSSQHEAVAEATVSKDHPEGTVTEVVQQGYTYTGGVLRPAKVVVARRRAEPSAASQVSGEATEPGADSTG
ncbi:MAG TPA: nucleotide exchange factor GrpE [Thermoplasmata archaeon]|nr:nucleotide exchange factor GrpE [Thermoplasmata archaeon]